MKKYSLAILFFLSLITAAFGNGKMDVGQAKAKNSSTVDYSITEQNNRVIPEIELANPGTVSGTQVSQQLQKATGQLFLPAKQKQVLIGSVVFAPAAFEVLSSDNNHLSHNYPSHNFW